MAFNDGWIYVNFLIVMANEVAFWSYMILTYGVDGDQPVMGSWQFKASRCWN